MKNPMNLTPRQIMNLLGWEITEKTARDPETGNTIYLYHAGDLWRELFFEHETMPEDLHGVYWICDASPTEQDIRAQIASAEADSYGGAQRKLGLPVGAERFDDYYWTAADHMGLIDIYLIVK